MASRGNFKVPRLLGIQENIYLAASPSQQQANLTQIHSRRASISTQRSNSTILETTLFRSELDDDLVLEEDLVFSEALVVIGNIQIVKKAATKHKQIFKERLAIGKDQAFKSFIQLKNVEGEIAEIARNNFIKSVANRIEKNTQFFITNHITINPLLISIKKVYSTIYFKDVNLPQNSDLLEEITKYHTALKKKQTRMGSRSEEIYQVAGLVEKFLILVKEIGTLQRNFDEDRTRDEFKLLKTLSFFYRNY